MLEKLLHIVPINTAIALALVLWIFAIYGYGFCLVSLLRKRVAIFSCEIASSSPLVWLLAFFVGMFALCFFVSVWHLFFPLWGAVSWVVALLGVGCFYRYSREFVQLDSRVALSAFLALLLVLPVALLSESMSDSVGYHIQAATWIQESPLVFGLGNVHSRLGYNGIIYGFYALTDVAQLIPHSFLHLRSFVGNEVVYFSFLFSAMFCFLTLLEKQKLRFYELFLVLALLPFPLILRWGEFRGLYCEGIGAVLGVAIFASLLALLQGFYGQASTAPSSQEQGAGASPQGELPSAVVPSIALNATALTPAPPLSQLPVFALLFFLALFGAMVKIANFALILAVLLCFLYVYRARVLARELWLGYVLLGGLSLVFVTPWVLKGYATSGMIAYPASIGYIPSLPWAVSEELRQGEVCWIMSWARDPSKYCADVLASHAWMWDWFAMKQRYFGHYFKWFVYAFFTCGVFSLLAFRLYRARVAGFGVVFLCIWVGVVYWFLAGPDPRFGMVYLIPLLASSFSYLLYQIYLSRSLLLTGGFMLPVLSMFMLWKNLLVFFWGALLLCVYERLSSKWLIRIFVGLTILGVAIFYRHEWREAFHYPKVSPVYAEERVSDLGISHFVHSNRENKNAQALDYEARPMTPYFNAKLGLGEFLGRAMYFTQKPKEQLKTQKTDKK